MTKHLPTDVVEARLNHLIDRARRGALLPEEADRFTTELRDLVRRLENEEDERAHDNVALRAIARQRDEAEARVTELEAENAALRDGLAHCRHKPRVTELEAEVARLTAGQCTHTRRMCDLHHQKPVADCPYPNCVKARTATA